MVFEKVACIVNYCTQDYRYLDLCLFELKKLFPTIIVPVCDHFYNGEPENRDLLSKGYQDHPDIQFIEFAFGERLYGLSPLLYDESKTIHYWHSTARYVGYHYLPNSIEWVLFLDIDEIIDLERFTKWFKSGEYNKYDALRFDSYFYFREPTQRAKTYTQNALMLRKSKCHADLLLVVAERMGTFDRILGERIEHVRGLDDAPLFHHYSWVRSHEELFHKVKCWGHHSEKDWTALLKQELDQGSRERDLLYNLEYEKCEMYHNPLKVDITYKGLGKSEFKNVVKVNHRSILERHFQI
ncbi:MAG: hypothetical protein P0S95_04545 [Rhabdochlamydiaceae bacterium]|nr:hypothetical protein [Candidatus Amphrikana amoebophyrae]